VARLLSRFVERELHHRSSDYETVLGPSINFVTERSRPLPLIVMQHYACLPMIDRALWHPWVRVQRLIRSVLETRWPGPAREVMKATLTRALPEREKIRRAGWMN